MIPVQWDKVWNYTYIIQANFILIPTYLLTLYLGTEITKIKKKSSHTVKQHSTKQSSSLSTRKKCEHPKEAGLFHNE